MNKKQLALASILAIPMLGFAQQRPNIVLILADDMRGSTLEFLEKEQAITPNLNALAADGTTFSNAHIMGGCNGAVSMPSRAMLMTGKYSYNLVKSGSQIPEDHVTIGQALIENGYNSYHIGKWHNDRKSFNRTFNGGDDIFFGGMADHWNVPLYSYNKDGDYSKKRPIINKPTENKHVDYLNGEYAYSGKHSVDIFTNRAIEYINAADDSKPFFLNVCLMSPHDPRSTYQSYYDMYNVDSIALPDNFLAEHPFDNGELKVRDEYLAAYPRVEGEICEHIRDYYAMITHVDHSVGQVIAALKAKGIYDNTIIVFAADNGLGVGQHGLLGKQNVYEHSVSVPLIIKDNQTRNVVNPSLCYLIDVTPTLLEYAQVDKPQDMDALSLIPTMQSGENIRPALYYRYREFQRAVSDGKMKLIEYHVNGERNTQLFDLENDPMETNNLSQSKSHKKQLAKMRKIMREQKTACNDNGDFWNGIEF